MISKKISLLAIGFNYQEINHIQDELAKEFSHFNFDFAISVRDSLYRLNIADYDIVLLDLTSSDIDNIVALKEIHQKGDGITTIATVKPHEVSSISNMLGINSLCFIAKDAFYAIKLVDSIKNMLNKNIVSQPTNFDRTLLEVLVNGMSEGVFFCDSENNIVMVNQATEKLLKTEKEKLLGKSIFVLPFGSTLHWLGKVIESAKSNIHLSASKKINSNNKWLTLRFIPLYRNKNQYIGGLLYLTDIATVQPFEEPLKASETDVLSVSKLLSSKILAEG